MDVTFFGVQIAVHAPPRDTLRTQFAAAIRSNDGDQSLTEKRAYHARLTALLDSCSARWRFGTWDFVSGPEAETKFDEWVSGLERATQENPGDVIDDDHLVVSLVYLLDANSDAESTAGERCDLPESEWHTRSTYSHLIATVRMLAFAGVRADGAYLVPGEGGPGLSAEELTGEGWDYLQVIGS